MPKITVKDMLVWLDYQRQVYNDAIVKAHPEDQRQFAWEVQHINAIEARIKEMAADEYLRVRNEMCAAYASADCDGCPFDSECGEDEPNCLLGNYERQFPSTGIEKIKRWKEEQDGISD